MQVGNFQIAAIITPEQLALPQFTMKRSFQATFHVLQKQINPTFNVIIGKNIQQQLWIKVLSSTKQLQWSDMHILMIPKGHWKDKNSICKQINEHQDDSKDHWLLDSNYQQEDIHTIVTK